MSNQYQRLRTHTDESNDEDLTSITSSPRKRCRSRCMKMVQVISLVLTAWFLGRIVYHYSDGYVSFSLQRNVTDNMLNQSLSSMAKASWDNLFTDPTSDAEVTEDQTLSIETNLKNTTQVVINSDLFGNFLDHLESVDKSRYVTAVPLGGINNQMTGTYNLMNLGRLSSRTVILPPIVPNEHQPRHIRGRSYSRYYDLPRMTAQTGIRLTEWNDLRSNVPATEAGEFAWTKRNWTMASNPLPCWVASKMGGPPAEGGRSLSARFGRGLMLEIKPQYAPGDESQGAWRSMAAAVKYLQTNASTVIHQAESKDVGCLTESYWLDTPKAYSDTQVLIRNFRFTKWLESIVDNAIAQVLGTSVQDVKHGKIKFITVHLRRNDIASKCKPAPKNWQSLAPTHYDPHLHKRLSFPPSEFYGTDSNRLLVKRKADWTNCRFTDSYIISRVNSLRKSLHKPDLPVILTTDDTNQASLAKFDAQPNWHRFNLDHFVSKEQLDDFDQVMIDACLLTRGTAFLGTGVSTMSRLAAQRGKAWYSRRAETF